MQRKRLEPEYTVKSIDNAFQLLEALIRCSSGANLTELAEMLSLSRNTTFRILKTLCEKRLAHHVVASGTYQLGFASTSLAHKLLKNMNVVNYAHPVLEDLVRKHDEAVYMTVIQDAEVLFVDMVDCDQAIKAVPLVGRRFPFFSNAAGKVLKSLDSLELLERLLKKVTRKSDRPDLDKLSLELSEIRTSGIAVDRGCGLGEGIISVAVAVRDYSGRVVGAITLLGPSFRIMADRVEQEIIPSLLEQADILSMKFGYTRV